MGKVRHRGRVPDERRPVDHVHRRGRHRAPVSSRLVAHAPSTLVFVGSGAGRQAYADNAAHVAAKHGLRGLAEALHLDVCDEGVTVSVISAGLVNAGAGSLAPAARSHPSALLRPEDIARAVEFVVDSPANVCPTEIVLRPATRHA